MEPNSRKEKEELAHAINLLSGFLSYCSLASWKKAEDLDTYSFPSSLPERSRPTSLRSLPVNFRLELIGMALHQVPTPLTNHCGLEGS